jgi:hypothetical protein
MDLTAHPRKQNRGIQKRQCDINVSEHHHPQHKILQNPNFREDIIPGQNANPKRVKKITTWVGVKKGREEEEEEEEDDDARMLDESPPLPSLQIPC